MDDDGTGRGRFNREPPFGVARNNDFSASLIAREPRARDDSAEAFGAFRIESSRLSPGILDVRSRD